MTKVLINVKKYAEYSTYTVNKGFIKIPSEFKPLWWNSSRQFTILNSQAKKFIEYLKENNVEIYYRYARCEDWEKLEY